MAIGTNYTEYPPHTSQINVSTIPTQPAYGQSNPPTANPTCEGPLLPLAHRPRPPPPPLPPLPPQGLRGGFEGRGRPRQRRRGGPGGRPCGGRARRGPAPGRHLPDLPPGASHISTGLGRILLYTSWLSSSSLSSSSLSSSSSSSSRCAGVDAQNSSAHSSDQHHEWGTSVLEKGSKTDSARPRVSG